MVRAAEEERAGLPQAAQVPEPVLRVVPQQEVPARRVLRAPELRERALKRLPASRVVLPILGATIIPSMIQVVRGMQARSPRPLGPIASEPRIRVEHRLAAVRQRG